MKLNEKVVVKDEYEYGGCVGVVVSTNPPIIFDEKSKHFIRVFPQEVRKYEFQRIFRVREICGN
jgi:hypothetical protein